jgi:hypothetical protein
MVCLSANIHIKQLELTEGSSSGIPRLAHNGVQLTMDFTIMSR